MLPVDWAARKSVMLPERKNACNLAYILLELQNRRSNENGPLYPTDVQDKITEGMNQLAFHPNLATCSLVADDLMVRTSEESLCCL